MQSYIPHMPACTWECKCSTVQYSAVQCYAVQCNAVQCCVVLYCAVLFALLCFCVPASQTDIQTDAMARDPNTSQALRGEESVTCESESCVR